MFRTFSLDGYYTLNYYTKVGTGLGYALLKGLASGIPGVEYRPPVSTMVVVAVAGLVLGLIASILPAPRS